MEVQVETQKIPWYRTRLLWGVVIGLLILWSLLFFFVFLPSASSLNEVLENIAVSFGAGYFVLLGTIFFGTLGSNLSAFIYFALMMFLGFKTFKVPRVHIIYPVIFVALFVSSMLFSIFLLAGL